MGKYEKSTKLENVATSSSRSSTNSAALEAVMAELQALDKTLTGSNGGSATSSQAVERLQLASPTSEMSADGQPPSVMPTYSSRFDADSPGPPERSGRSIDKNDQIARNGVNNQRRSSATSSDSNLRPGASPAGSARLNQSSNRQQEGKSQVEKGSRRSETESARKAVAFKQGREIENTSASSLDEQSQLVVARGSTIKLQSTGEMLADKDSDNDVESSEEADYRSESNAKADDKLTVNEVRRPMSATNDRQQNVITLQRDRVQSAHLRRISNSSSVNSEKAGSILAPSSPVQSNETDKSSSNSSPKKLTAKQKAAEAKRQKEQEMEEIFNCWVAQKKKQKAEERERQEEREERLRRIEERKKREEQRKQEEEAEKRHRERMEKLNARREKEEIERNRTENNEYYQNWLAAKREQIQKERRLEEERRKDLSKIHGLRSPSEEREHQRECERAFNEWKRRKALKAAQEKALKEENTRLTRLIMKHLARSQQLSSAESTSSTRYTDYFGYRY